MILAAGPATATATSTSVADTAIGVKSVATPILRLRGENLLAASCVAAGNCVAVGSYQSANGNRIGLVLTDRGGTWRADGALPLPPATHRSILQPYVPELSSVSCVAIDACVAVANYLAPRNSPNSLSKSLVLVESRGGWTSAIAPMPSGAGGASETLKSVSCSSLGTARSSAD